MSHRPPDRVVELTPGRRSIKHPEPVPPEAYKADEYGPGRDPTEAEKRGETEPGPEYLRAEKHEGKRMSKKCAVTLEPPPPRENQENPPVAWSYSKLVRVRYPEYRIEAAMTYTAPMTLDDVIVQTTAEHLEWDWLACLKSETRARDRYRSLPVNEQIRCAQERYSRISDVLEMMAEHIEESPGDAWEYLASFALVFMEWDLPGVIEGPDREANQ